MGERSDFNQIEHVFVNIYCYSCPHYDCLQLNKSNNSSKDDQHHLNIIVKNLPYDKREENDNSILFSKVAGLMTDGLKLTNIGIKNVIRKTNRSDSKPGIVVISFENLVQKKSVLKEKWLLKNSSKYSNVFIENDLPLQQRIVNNNNRILLKALQSGSQWRRRVPSKNKVTWLSRHFWWKMTFKIRRLTINTYAWNQLKYTEYVYG